MKAWHWLEGVPLVGALSGRRVLDTSATHRRLQAAMLLLLLMAPIIALSMILVWQRQREAMPKIVRFAGGIEGGVYNDVSTELAHRLGVSHDVTTQIVGSGGSLDNRDRLLSGTVDLAPMQATAISGDPLCVVAPLFYEVLYVLAQVNTEIHSIHDLRGHHVAVGPLGSGSRATAELVLTSLNLTSDLVTRDVIDWQQLFSDDAPDAAMLCIGQGSPLVSKLLKDGQWRLVPVPRGVQISLEHPTLRPMTIEANELSGRLSGDATAEGIPTVGTTAYLAAREDTPSELVVAVLDALYQAPPPFIGLIPRDQSAEWQGLAFHPAARQYFVDLQSR